MKSEWCTLKIPSIKYTFTGFVPHSLSYKIFSFHALSVLCKLLQSDPINQHDVRPIHFD